MGKTKIKKIDMSEQVVTRGDSEAKRGVTASGESHRAPAANKASEDSRMGLRDDRIPNEQPKTKAPKKSRAAQNIGKVRSQKYQKAAELIDRDKKYPLLEAVKLAQQASYSKFAGTMEAHLNTTVKNLRGLVSLPHLSGKKLTVLAFGKNGEKAGADIVGNEETIAEIEAGKINFDVLVTTPEWMPKLAKVAKILGPRGLMPNPKNETVTENLAKSIADLKGGKIEYKTEANGKVIHLPIGKVDQTAEEVAANLKVLHSTIGKSKISKVTLSSTMGPGVKVELSSI